MENAKLKINEKIDENLAKIAEIKNKIDENKQFSEFFHSLLTCKDLDTCNKILNGSNYIKEDDYKIKKLENEIKKLETKQLETKQSKIKQLQDTLLKKKELLDKYIQKLVKYKNFIIEIFKDEANKDEANKEQVLKKFFNKLNTVIEQPINQQFIENKRETEKTTNAIFELTDDELKLFKILYRKDEKNKITDNLNLDKEKKNLEKEIEDLKIKLAELNSITIQE